MLVSEVFTEAMTDTFGRRIARKKSHFALAITILADCLSVRDCGQLLPGLANTWNLYARQPRWENYHPRRIPFEFPRVPFTPYSPTLLGQRLSFLTFPAPGREQILSEAEPGRLYEFTSSEVLHLPCADFLPGAESPTGTGREKRTTGFNEVFPLHRAFQQA